MYGYMRLALQSNQAYDAVLLSKINSLESTKSATHQ